jgi:hypothetical protein
MTTPNDGGPAFPSYKPAENRSGFNAPVLQAKYFAGMSLRDWFAGQALAGMAASELWTDNFDFSSSAKEKWLPDVAKVAYLAADAMLQARSQQE